MNETVNNISTRLVGQQQWLCKVIFDNHKQPPYEIPQRLIPQLSIEDDILTWPLRGYLIVENRMEGFERDPLKDEGRFIRSDARDELHIELYPDPSTGSFPDNIWKITLDAVIYDVEDMPSENMTNKSKKLYFWDKKFQGMLEKNLQWSSATGFRYFTDPCPKPVAHQPDEYRAMYTGDIIASLLYEAGYEAYIDFNNWDWGAGKLNFTAKADWNLWDCIMYVLKHHVASDDNKNDICIFNWNRSTNMWNLTPVHKFFAQAGIRSPGDLQLEHLFFEARGGNIYSSPWKAPFSNDQSLSKDIKSTYYGTIYNYNFSQASGLDNAKAYRSKPIYSHWHKNKQFNVDVKNNEITEVRETFIKPNYISQLLKSSSTSLVALNKTKTTAESVEPQFSPVSIYNPVEDKKMRTLDGRGKILYANLFLNHCMSMRLIGGTHRMTGTFIGIDRMSEPSDNTYDYQVCGQYFVVNVKHILQNQKYVNDIVMVKIHAFDKLPIDEGIS